MDRQILEAIRNETGNTVFPFLWLKGKEDEETIRREIGKIDSCGVKALCLESRPHPDFAGPLWWRDLDIVFDEAKKRGMRVWILDDKHFPTGYANGLIRREYPERAKQYLSVKICDVTGPVTHGTLDLEASMKRVIPPDPEAPAADGSPAASAEREDIPDGEIVSLIAMRMEEDDTVTGDPVNAGGRPNRIILTDRVRGGQVICDFPAGVWRIFAVYTTLEGGGADDYINIIDEDSVRVLIEAVYEPHYRHFQKEFGRTFAGFFSDEPGFGNTYGYRMDEAVGRKMMQLPWNREVPAELEKRLGERWAELLPLLWFPSSDREQTARVRHAYMDTVTRLYEKNFSRQLGRWCSVHGVSYIGHIIEDNNVNGRLGCGAGHYFRAMSGQEMAGIDVIGGQIVPGNPNTVRHDFIPFDGKFFHYILPKLGSSAALMQKGKQGRLLCEAFGVYGWGFGVRDMKWLTDFLLARGVNHLVPHAFSMDRYPDPDCPPHFYAGGHHPEFPYFGRLMRYFNRMAHVFSGGRWVPEVGLLYHAPMEWMDDCMPDQVPAKMLQEHFIDYAIVPSDALSDAAGCGDGTYDASVENGRLVIGGVPIKLLIVPEGRFADPQLVRFMQAYPEVRILFVGAYPEAFGADGKPDEELQAVVGQGRITEPEKFISTLHEMGVVGARSNVTGDAAFYHYEKESGDLWMVFNESMTEVLRGTLLVKTGTEDRHIYRYDAMKNEAYPVEHIRAWGFDDPRMLCTMELQPYESAVFFTAREEEVRGILSPSDPAELTVKKRTDLSDGWQVHIAGASDDPQYVPLPEAVRAFRAEGGMVLPGAEESADGMGRTLMPISDLLPRFSGLMRYTREIEISDPSGCYAIEAEHFYEVGRVLVNGTETDFCLCPPYRFRLDGLKAGSNTVIIEAANTPLRDTLNYGGADPDHGTSILEPSGMFGKVSLVELA